MKKTATACMLFVMLGTCAMAQSRKNDISVSQLPKAVRQVLDQYIDILSTSKDLDECAQRFVNIAGGALVNEDGRTLRNSVMPYSLKKDFGGVKFYQQPLAISRVNASPSNGTGFGPSAIRGMVYKIWIDKKPGQAGMPAPISIMVPEGHAEIKSPKVVNIGSL